MSNNESNLHFKTLGPVIKLAPPKKEKKKLGSLKLWWTPGTGVTILKYQFHETQHYTQDRKSLMIPQHYRSNQTINIHPLSPVNKLGMKERRKYWSLRSLASRERSHPRKKEVKETWLERSFELEVACLGLIVLRENLVHTTCLVQ